MIRSMTGYGEAERELPDGRLRVEIRTVNHRHFHPRIRIPPSLERLQGDVEGWLREFMSRGHLNVSISVEGPGADDGEPLPELDVERARRYRDLLERMRDELELPGEATVSDLARFGDLFRRPEPEEAASRVEEEDVREAVRAAAAGAVSMREKEGRRLQDDLEERMDELAAHLDRVEERAPERLASERERLRERIRELTESEEVDEDRLAREVAYMADKWDISEEIVRFRAHIAHFREILAEPSPEPAGKRLGFVVQEMHREGNTIGAKANDPEISQAVVGIKEEIERLREQVENVE